ncbi:MAG: hypothetical protein QGG73_04500 [Candidatus Hydrogenedentes bacterium]|nr:hypothetical protein [Candidatus Hydrogenedentota bacterium]
MNLVAEGRDPFRETAGKEVALHFPCAREAGFVTATGKLPLFETEVR